jgi:predicted TIM-barrel fold metal-dependent hydrolase
MKNIFSRRHLLGWLGASPFFAAGVSAQTPRQPARVRDLHDAMTDMPLADVHCHGFPPLTPVTEPIFLHELAMPAWMLPAYFTVDGDNVYRRWRDAQGDEKARLDKTYGIQGRFDQVIQDFAETAFAKYLVKEMAGFFKCKPTLRDVVGARNERTQRSYWGYVNDLFSAVKLEDLYVTSVLGAWNLPSTTIEDFAAPLKSRVHPIHSVAATEGPLLNENISFDTLLTRYTEGVTRQIKDNKRVGFKTHIATRAGLDIPPMRREEGEAAWDLFRKMTPDERRRQRPGTLPLDSPERKVRHYLTWLTCSIAYDLDVPFHIHSGDGGEGQGNLSRQFPYNLENVARWPVDYPQKPVKIVMVHGGYPHVDQAAYMSHIFPNVWYEMSWMNPIANRGLREKLISVFETAPFSKIMYGSDAYHLPEFLYVAGKWGRKYIASALGVLIDDGVLTQDEAVRVARMILSENANRLHKVQVGTTTSARI